MIRIAKTFYIGCVLATGLGSCTANFRTTVVHPAEIAIPADLDSIIVVNRTKPESTGTKVGNVVEGILSGEAIIGDQYGVNKTMTYLLKGLHDNDRLTVMHGEPVMLTNVNGTFEYNIPIKSEVLDSLAKEYDADGILALEFFDSDRTGSGSSGTAASYVRSYWRLYYPVSKEIVDGIELNTYGRSTYEYISILPAGYSSVSRGGIEAADRYIRRIIPSSYNEGRMYYIKGCDELKLAAEYIKIGEWERAKFTLEEGTQQSYSPKVLGRLAYNLGVVNEQLDDLDKALSWAVKSTETGNNSAPQLIKILQTRKNELPLIEEQMKRE